MRPAAALSAALLAACLFGPAAPSFACEKPDDPGLLFWSCGPEARLLLLPEDAGAPPVEPDLLTVTGAYTATDRRDDARPKPVGLFVRAGEVVSREYVRFDGVATVEAGRLAIHYRRAVELGERRFDLEAAEDRAAFLDMAAARDASVFQSHLLIISGRVDTRPVDGAPVFRRRILFQTEDGGVGVWDSSPGALTLDEAAREVQARFKPAMALNLDMGSYDFCLKGATLCGALAYAQTGKLSNMLQLRAGG